MLVKDLLNWKELDDEQKAATKKKLADAAKIGAGFAAGVGAVCLGYKAVEKIYPKCEIAFYHGENNSPSVAFESTTKSGKICPLPIHNKYLVMDKYEDAIDDLNTGIDFFKNAIAARDAEAFNDAITEALD